MKEEDFLEKSTIKYIPYDNIEVYHPRTGKLMCMLSKKRANWYLKKGLAERITDKSIKLTFVPNGHGEEEIYLVKRANVCVVSGSNKNLTKHHVVPTQFRQWFPLKYKNNNSFDIVLLSRKIHDIYETHATFFKNKLYDDFITEDEKNLTHDLFTIEKLKRSISNRNYFKVPTDKRVKTEIMLYGIQERINKLSDDKIRIARSNFDSIIIDRIGVENFIVLWKYHFIKYAKPRFLPIWWKPNLIKYSNKCKNEESETVYKNINQLEISCLLNKYDLLN